MIKSHLVPASINCKYCNKLLLQIMKIADHYNFYCDNCKQFTKWYYQTRLEKMQMTYSFVEKLIIMFLDNKTAKDAYDFLNYEFCQEKSNINTVRRYFTLFCNITLSYYQNHLDSTILEGNIEIDESHLFKEKKTHAPRRQYKLRSVWLFGFKKRDSSEFLLIPMTSREEINMHLAIVKHVKKYSTLYTDSYAAYVNNHTKKSKLEDFGFCHEFVNHRIQFVSSLFPEVHTNTVERLWRIVKNDLKRTKVTTKYVLGIARFTFLKNLTQAEQIKILCEGLRKEKIE